MSKLDSALLLHEFSKDEILEAKIPFIDRMLLYVGVVTYRARNITEAHKAGGCLPEYLQWCYPYTKIRVTSYDAVVYRLKPGKWVFASEYHRFINSAEYNIRQRNDLAKFLEIM
jgi:hypothetical protein|nr:MAG TPA: hypothetical protein [Caudoviricetes sp.]